MHTVCPGLSSWRVTSDDDLGALCARATRRLIAAERPLLDRHGLSMWQYIVLSQLARASAPTQLELARAIGYDKTRLITLLDELQAAGLISREPDPTDRRARLVSLTAKGARRQTAARAAIRAMEERKLGNLAPAVRRQLRAGLALLADHPEDPPPQ
jgi:MarR family transcriptional regulator, organic hydroperoxide resistance regulator